MDHFLNKIKCFLHLTKDKFFFIIVRIKLENDILNFGYKHRNLYRNRIFNRAEYKLRAFEWSKFYYASCTGYITQLYVYYTIIVTAHKLL